MNKRWSAHPSCCYAGRQAAAKGVVVSKKMAAETNLVKALNVLRVKPGCSAVQGCLSLYACLLVCQLA